MTCPCRIKEGVNNRSLVLSDGDLDLLSKGPNFAITQRISESVLLEAEKGVERLAYAKCWQDTIRRAKATTNSSTSPTQESTPENDPTTSTRTTPPNTNEPTAPNRAEAPPADTDSQAAAGASGGSPSVGPTTRAADSVPLITATATTTRNTRETQATSTITTNRQSATGRSGLSFRFPDTDKKFPPPSSVDVERKLKTLKDDIMKTYKSHNVKSSNVSGEQLSFLKMRRKTTM